MSSGANQPWQTNIRVNDITRTYSHFQFQVKSKVAHTSPAPQAAIRAIFANMAAKKVYNPSRHSARTHPMATQVQFVNRFACEIVATIERYCHTK